MTLTGEQFEISAGAYRAVITESGGGLRELTYSDESLILSHDADEIAPAAFGQLLVPWPNRIDHGRYEFAGEQHQLDINEPEYDCAIHGLVRWATWTPLSRSHDRVSLACRLLGSPGYPYQLDLEVEYVLDTRHGLLTQLTATNTGTRAAPYGHGVHPYLTVGQQIDTCTVQLPGDTYLPVNDRMIPFGPVQPVEGSEYDLRAGRVLGDQQIDLAFAGLARDSDDRAWVTLTGDARAVSLWLDQSHPWLEIYTADGVPDKLRRQGLGVEPMTCPPNAFATGIDLQRLEPDASFTGSWGILAG